MIIFSLFTAGYILYFIWNIYNWSRIPQTDNFDVFSEGVSVLVPIRNELQNLSALFESLSTQTHLLFEVILIDDHSEDGSYELASQLLTKYELRGEVCQLEPDQSGKKSAITLGIKNATYDLIITTDGDCTAGPHWVSSMASPFQNNEIQFISGPVKMRKENFFTGLQAVEFAGLIGAGAASLSAGFPGMCNGANMAYRKSAFEEVGGYEGNLDIASGDDEFLLQKLFKRFPDRARFLKSKYAIVRTPAKQSLGALVRQRKRWSSKWKFHKSWFIRLMAIGIFSYCLLTVAFWILIIVGESSYTKYFLLIMLFKALSEFAFISMVSNFLGLYRLFFESFLLSIIYPFFVTFLGIASIFGHYSWKGRSYL